MYTYILDIRLTSLTCYFTSIILLNVTLLFLHLSHSYTKSNLNYSILTPQSKLILTPS